MAMRDLISGGAACAVPGSSSSSNPLGALANKLLGSSSKAQELTGLPGTSVTVPSSSQAFGAEVPLSMIPGSEYDNPQFQQPGIQSSQFLRGFHSSEHGGLEEAWNEARQPHFLPPSVQGGAIQPHFQEFDQIYERGASSNLQPALDGPPQRVLSNFLHSFVESGRAGVPFHPIALPALGLSKGDKQCIRDRSYIMARHIFADKNEDYIHSQVNALLHSLEIDGDERLRGPLPGTMPEFEEYWTESQGSRPGANSWVSEFSQQRHDHGDPESWANSFEKMHGANGWASEFDQEQAQRASMGQMNNGQMLNIEAMEQTRMLAHTLAQNNDPKIQNSKFLQFVSKMSRGELIIDENQVKPAVGSSSDWANEFQTQYNSTPDTWASEFAQQEVSQGSESWVNQYLDENQPTEDQWVKDFSKLHVEDWADEFGKQMGDGMMGDGSTENWADTYDSFLKEQQSSNPSNGIYVFSDLNPYVGHADPFKEGQELFRKGLLSEAVLALEAEVLKNPENAEAWRLLGITHAENDDDQQAISSMLRAQEADPINLEVLLALGVSHTNELEQASALKYLYGWLQNHPKYGHLTSQVQMESLFHADVSRLFNEAAQITPDEADIHIVLGVLYNLSREYDKAVNSFQTALKLKPNDYSLWNKLGATQANSIQSADAILAYQQVMQSPTAPDKSLAAASTKPPTTKKYNSGAPFTTTSFDRGKEVAKPENSSSRTYNLNPGKLPVKKQLRLTDAEFQARREKGLCFHCDDKFSPGHKCKKELNILLVHDEDEHSQEEIEPDWAPVGSESIEPRNLAYLCPLRGSIALCWEMVQRYMVKACTLKCLLRCKALDLKPNYVRAWANMGISYANQGLYEDSIRYYVKALSMNPKADNAWQYLRISLSCASRNDMFDACDSRNLDLLQKEFPL